jgi:hypothetical protein
MNYFCDEIILGKKTVLIFEGEKDSATAEA